MGALVAPEVLERYLSTGKLPDPETDLLYKMYAVVRNSIVEGYVWEPTEDASVEYVLMTYDNSPAYVKGIYKEGKFYPPKAGS